MLSRVSLPRAGSQCKIAGRATARDINLIEKVCIAHVKANVASIRDKISELDPTRSHHMNLEIALTGARVEYRAVKCGACDTDKLHVRFIGEWTDGMNKIREVVASVDMKRFG